MFFIFQNSSGAHNRFQITQFLLGIFSQRNKKTRSSLDVSEKVAIAAEPDGSSDLALESSETKFQMDFLAMLEMLKQTFQSYDTLGFPDLPTRESLMMRF